MSYIINIHCNVKIHVYVKHDSIHLFSLSDIYKETNTMLSPYGQLCT